MMIFADSELTTQTIWIASGTIIAGLGLLAVAAGFVWAGGKLAGLLQATLQRLEANDDEHGEFRDMLGEHGERIGSLEGWRSGRGHGRSQ